jgi:hypothetical protein
LRVWLQVDYIQRRSVFEPKRDTTFVVRSFAYDFVCIYAQWGDIPQAALPGRDAGIEVS